MPSTFAVPEYTNGTVFFRLVLNTWYVCFCVPNGNTYPTRPVCRTDVSPLTLAPQQSTSWPVRRLNANVRVICWTGWWLVRSYT